MNYINYNNKFFKILETFFSSKYFIFILLIWTFFEASIWFIIPDFILLLSIIIKPHYYKKFLLITFTSSMIGIIFFYFFILNFPNFSLESFLRIPFTNQVMVDNINLLYSNQGIISVLKQSISGIPSKLWTYSAVKFKFSLINYIFFVSVSRGIRMFIVSIVASIVGVKGSRILKNHSILFFISYVIFFFTMLYSIS
ncbi:hypothetical protein HOD20_10020 [archaeon]|jgi:membrane protein YqaA with SNARE-associated domain|nr:hypothetical protein [archaeon]